MPLMAASFLASCQHREQSAATPTAAPNPTTTSQGAENPALTDYRQLAKAQHAQYPVIGAYVQLAGAHLAKFVRYPAGGHTPVFAGTTFLRLHVARDGSLIDVAVVQSSGTSTLDGSALSAAQRASPFPPLPPEVTLSAVYFIVPIDYRLPRQ